MNDLHILSSDCLGRILLNFLKLSVPLKLNFKSLKLSFSLKYIPRCFLIATNLTVALFNFNEWYDLLDLVENK